MRIATTKKDKTLPPEDYRSVLRESREHKSLALKTAKLAMSVLPIFEKESPKDSRPRMAIEALRAWAQNKKKLTLVLVRKLSLDSHAAAREATSDKARFAARAAGQAIATWHVPNHASKVPVYVRKVLEVVK